MCIIVIKPAGQALPAWNILGNCFWNNPDGAGFMYPLGDHVQIEKGLMSLRKLKKAIGALKIDTTGTPIIFHFRIGTAGGNTPENTHPFPVTESISAMQKIRSRASLAVVHNGMIDIVPRKKDISDTMEYTASQLAPLYQLQHDFYRLDAGKKLIYNATMSKLAFMDNSGQIETVGEFITDDGISYSNTSYLPRIYYQKWDIYDDYMRGLDADTDILPLMWLTDEDGYIIDHEGIIQSAEFYMIDEVGKLYEYDYESDCARPCRGELHGHNSERVEYDEERAEHCPVAATYHPVKQGRR